MATISSSETFTKRRVIFLCVHRTEDVHGYVIGANQNVRKLIWSTDLVNTKIIYCCKYDGASNIITGTCGNLRPANWDFSISIMSTNWTGLSSVVLNL